MRPTLWTISGPICLYCGRVDTTCVALCRSVAASLCRSVARSISLFLALSLRYSCTLSLCRSVATSLRRSVALSLCTSRCPVSYDMVGTTYRTHLPQTIPAPKHPRLPIILDMSAHQPPCSGIEHPDSSPSHPAVPSYTSAS